MRSPDLVLQLDADRGQPLYLRIAEALARNIQSGAIRTGSALPGIRGIADQLKVNRNTVAAAYQELEAEGWVETKVGSGTFAAMHLPELWPTRWGPEPVSDVAEGVTAFDVASGLRPFSQPLSAAFDLRDGHPDPRLLPAEELGSAYQRGLMGHGGELLHYGDPLGQRSLREAMAQWLMERRGIMVGPERILITRGARMGLDLLARGLLSPGDAVAVEDPGHRIHAETLQAAGARLVPIPVDEHGLRVDLLAEAVERERIRMVYFTPHHQFPTGVTLSAERRTALLALAESHRLALIEDDFDFEWHFEGRPLLPLASQDARGSVLTLGSFSRVLAPGLRLGFLVGKASVLNRLARLRSASDAHGDRVLEQALASLIREGSLARTIRRARKAYQLRRDRMQEILATWPGFQVQSAGGLGLWIKTPEGLDLPTWIDRAKTRGVLLLPGGRYLTGAGSIPFIRLGFGAHTPDEITQAMELLKG